MIACISLTAIALLLEERKELSGWKQMVVVAALIMVMFWDQVPEKEIQSQGDRDKEQEYIQYFAEVEKELGSDTMVYQLPWASFPENGYIYEMNDYAHFKGYIYTDTIKWSYGGERGRNKLSKELNVDHGMGNRFLKGIQDAGFKAVYIDTTGFIDSGEEIIAYYNSLGSIPLVNASERIYIYDISNVQIDENKLVPGFRYFERMIKALQVDVSDEEIICVLELISSDSEKATDNICAWIASSDVNNYGDIEFIDFALIYILGRSDGQDVGWIEAIKNGMPRRDIIRIFIESEEFKQNCF